MRHAITAAGLLLAFGSAHAAAQEVVTLPFEYLVTDFSEDGLVAVGNLWGPFETFRYEWGGSPVLLGRGTVATIGTGAGTPDVSYDGSVVSATVLDQSETLQTMGVWTQAGGWTTLETVPYPDARVVDNSFTSCWSLSGDGASVGGFFWYQNPGEFGANPCVWTPDTGDVERLPVGFDRSGRVNGLSYDGSVRVGWEEDPTGAWQPTVWRGQAKFQLGDDGVLTTCEQVSADGSTVVGYSFVFNTQNRAATVWRWDGAGYVKQVLGQLPGTPAFQGWSIANGVTDDGSIVVGSNYYSSNPGGNADGFVWTPSGGLMTAQAYLASRGVEINDMDIREMTVSPDGSTFALMGFDNQTLRFRTTLVRFPGVCRADFDNNGSLNFFDISAFISAFSAQDNAADIAEPFGVFNFFDVSAYIGLFNAGCP